jgi:hypothetical protein
MAKPERNKSEWTSSALICVEDVNLLMKRKTEHLK